MDSDTELLKRFISAKAKVAVDWSLEIAAEPDGEKHRKELAELKKELKEKGIPVPILE